MTTTPRWTEGELRSALDEYEDELRAAGKARNTISTYVQHPERFINWLVGTYRPQRSDSPATSGAPSGGRSKYDRLREHLDQVAGRSVQMSFTDVEAVLGFTLPASARRYPAWWSNESAGTHVHAQAWMASGWRTSRLDLSSGTVVFAR